MKYAPNVDWAHLANWTVTGSEKRSVVYCDTVIGVWYWRTQCRLFVQFLLLSTVEDLFVHVDRDQLTADLGGTFPFNVNEWIQHRSVCFSLANLLVR